MTISSRNASHFTPKEVSDLLLCVSDLLLRVSDLMLHVSDLLLRGYAVHIEKVASY
jgi:hypothetical protein